MPQGKYTAADIDKPAGGMPNAGPMGKYTSADVDGTPTPADDDPISRFFQGAGNRIKGIVEGATPQGVDEIIGGPGYKLMKGAVQGAKGAYDSAQKSAEEGDIPGSMLKSVAAAIPLVGPGAASIYDRAKSGDTAGAMGMGGVDALAMLLPTKGGEVADVAADAAAHPVIRGAGRVVRDFDITKPFKSIGENVAGPAMEKLGQMRAARGRPQLQSPLDPSAGVRVQGGGVQSPRIPSPAEDLISAMDNESAVRRAPDTKPAPPQVRVKHVQEGIQSPLEPGTSAVQPRQFGDTPVSADASDVPTLAEEMQSPLEPGTGTVAPRSMQPTADMTTGGGGANYSADDLANLISKHNIPPAPGEIVGGTPPPSTVRVYHGTDFNNVANIGREGIKPGPAGGPWFTTSPEDAVSYGQPSPFSEGPQISRPSIIQADIPQGYINKDLSDFMGEDEHGNPIYNHELDDLKVDPDQITGVRHLQHRGHPEALDDAAILEAMREDLDAHGRNALHEESTDFAARNKVGKSKTGKAGYGFDRKLPEAQSDIPPEVIRQAERLGVDPDGLWREMQEHNNRVAEQEPRDRAREEFKKGPKGKKQ